MVDVEADGPIPGDYSMTEVGVVRVDAGLGCTFHGKLRPLPGAKWDPNALAVVGYTHEHSQTFNDPCTVMAQLKTWLQENNQGNRPMFISDNNGFDYGFVNWYFHHFIGANPFGHSSTNLGSLYKGVVRDFSQNFKVCGPPCCVSFGSDAAGSATSMARTGGPYRKGRSIVERFART